jgi:hypothetical protein
MSVDRTNTIEWNGNELSGWIMINGAPTKVSADRDTIIPMRKASVMLFLGRSIGIGWRLLRSWSRSFKGQLQALHNVLPRITPSLNRPFRGDPHGKARRVSSGTVVRRAAK